MAVFERPNGRWSAQVYDPAAKRAVSVAKWAGGQGTFATRGEAVQAVRDAETALRAMPSPPPPPTVADWRATWLREGADRWRDKTLRHNEERTERFVSMHGRIPVVDFTPEMAAAWAAESPGTVNALRSMFGRAVEHEVIFRSPWLSVPRSASRPARPSVLTELEVEELARAARASLAGYGAVAASMILVAAWTSVQPSELFELRRADVDFDANELSVSRSTSSPGRVDPTVRSHRRVVLPPKAAAAIRDAMPTVSSLTGKSDDHTLLFTNSRGTQWSQPGWQQKWHGIRQAAGLPDLVFSDLRHFGASWLLAQGASPQDVATQIGHRDGGKLVIASYGEPPAHFARARIRLAIDGAVRAASA